MDIIHLIYQFIFLTSIVLVMKVVYGIVLTMELLISLTVHQAMMLKSYAEVCYSFSKSHTSIQYYYSLATFII